jgi:hypothetical protein
VFANTVLRRILGPKRQKVTEGRKKLYIEKVHIIIGVSESSRIRVAMPAAYTAAMSNIGLYKTTVQQRERNQPFLKL